MKLLMSSGPVFGVLFGLCMFISVRRFVKFYILKIRKTDVMSKTDIIVCNAVSVAIGTAVGCCFINVRWLSAIFALHMLLFYVLFDLLHIIIVNIFKRKERFISVWKIIHGCGLVPLIAAILVFGYGVWNMNHVVQTTYNLSTDKPIRSEGYTVAMLTDIHYGTIQDSSVLLQAIDEINQIHPDIVILGGDIVEEGTSKEKMQEVFSMLGTLKSGFGVYYIYGNHDRQIYTSMRSYTFEELAQAIEGNGIKILDDGVVEIGGELILAGRSDAGWGNTSGRLTSDNLIGNADKNKYIIVADHQPIEAEQNDTAGADLQLSGHTHAGQIWPLGLFLEMSGLNYGRYQEGDCTVIVSSGVTGWGYTFRTEQRCEYVIVNIKGN